MQLYIFAALVALTSVLSSPVPQAGKAAPNMITANVAISYFNEADCKAFANGKTVPTHIIFSLFNAKQEGNVKKNVVIKKKDCEIVDGVFTRKLQIKKLDASPEAFVNLLRDPLIKWPQGEFALTINKFESEEKKDTIIVISPKQLSLNSYQV